MTRQKLQPLETKLTLATCPFSGGWRGGGGALFAYGETLHMQATPPVRSDKTKAICNPYTEQGKGAQCNLEYYICKPLDTKLTLATCPFSGGWRGVEKPSLPMEKHYYMQATPVYI